MYVNELQLMLICKTLNKEIRVQYTLTNHSTKILINAY